MNILQIALIVAAICVVVVISLRRKGLPLIILVGFALRAALAIYDDQRFALPWSGADSAKFYAQLLDFCRLPFLRALQEIPLSRSAMYPWVISWAARLAGPNYLFLVFINVIVGTFSILQTYRLATEFLSRKHALGAAWFVCLFPVSAVLSAVFIRETLIAAFLIAASRQMVLAIKHGVIAHVVQGAVYIFMAALFHGALILCLALFPLGYLLATIIKKRRAENNAASPVRLLLVSVALLGAVISTGAQLSKIGSLEDIPDVMDARAARESRRMVATNSDYPVWLSRNIYRPDIAAIRYAYFMFSPFPWMWRGLADVAGAALGAANFYVFWLVFRARRKLPLIPLALFLGAVLTTLMYSAGVSNVGTAIRHRNKVVPVLCCSAIAAYGAVHGRMRTKRNTPWENPRPVLRGG